MYQDDFFEAYNQGEYVVDVEGHDVLTAKYSEILRNIQNCRIDKVERFALLGVALSVIDFFLLVWIFFSKF